MIKLQTQEKIAPHFEAQSLFNDYVCHLELLFGVHGNLDAVVAVDENILDKLADIGSSNLVHSLFVTILGRSFEILMLI